MNSTFLLDWINAILQGSQVAVLAALLVVVFGAYIALVLTRR